MKNAKGQAFFLLYVIFTQDRTYLRDENSLQFKLGKKQPVFQKHLGWQLKTELNDIF